MIHFKDKKDLLYVNVKSSAPCYENAAYLRRLL